MSILDSTQEIRTKITYKSCSALGMRYVDTIYPQYLYQIERPLVLENGQTIAVFEEFVRVLFNLNDGTVTVRYTKDHWDVRGRHWETLENPSEEELNLLVAALSNQFNKGK